MNDDPENEAISKLSKDLREAAKTLTPNEVRFLVDSYYQMQENRIRSDGQIRALETTAEPHRVLDWLSINAETLENQIRKALDYYSNDHPVGKWSRSVCGIGPVIAAGLLAHIDIKRAPTVGHIWSFAGLNPNKKWLKGEKRPWNASLKTLCWKIGESFVKVSGNPKAYYGHIYVERKAREIAFNDAGKYADQARQALEEKKYSKETEAYKAYIQNKLPPGRIQSRAKRYAVKLFLAHWHEVAYRNEFHTDPPIPYPIAILGHDQSHYKPVPE